MAEATDPSASPIRLPLRWKVVIIASACLSVLAVLVALQNQMELHLRQTQIIRSDAFKGTGFHLVEAQTGQRRAAIQMAKENVEFSAWGDGGYARLWVPPHRPPLLIVSTANSNVADPVGVQLRVQSSSDDDIALAFYDKDEKKRIGIGISQEGEPYFDAYRPDGLRIWSLPQEHPAQSPVSKTLKSVPADDADARLWRDSPGEAGDSHPFPGE